ncbi:MAG TPA: hypothetical protein VHM93_12230 [Candidatus Acidoferrum sp.]|jgi:hypothetical protein|nr:hypothetical protein [Candidatus Acidoferrum sp.]
MKLNLMFLASLLLVISFGVALARKSRPSGTSCGFTVQGESVEPTIKGPDDLVPLVYVVEQPESPIEMVSVDLTGMWLSTSHEQSTAHFCGKYHVRNRSDQTIQKFQIALMLSTIGGAGGLRSAQLFGAASRAGG